MVAYTDYKFYTRIYKGDMPEDDFDRAVIEASLEIRNRIMGRDISNFEEIVQMATCSVADILYKISLLEDRKQKLVSSDSSDRVLASVKVANLSKSFANTTSLSELEQEISDMRDKIGKEIEKHLAFTGLLYRGV